MNCKDSLVEEWNLSGPILHELEDIFKIGLPFRQVSCSFSLKCLGNVPTCCLHWKRMLENWPPMLSPFQIHFGFTICLGSI